MNDYHPADYTVAFMWSTNFRHDVRRNCEVFAALHWVAFTQSPVNWFGNPPYKGCGCENHKS